MSREIRSSAIISIVGLIEILDRRTPIALRRGESFALALGKIDSIRNTLDISDAEQYGEQTSTLIRSLYGL